MADNQITPFQLTDQFTMDNFNQRINETNTALQNKAPAGFGGFGEVQTIVDVNNDETAFNSAIDGLLSGMKDGSSMQIRFANYPVYGGDGTIFSGFLFKSSNNYVALHGTNYAGGSIQKIKNGGTWKPWEWVNPPMLIGVEYRTTERYLGKPVYAQLFSVGACSAGSSVNLYKSVGTLNTDKIVSYCGYAADCALPYFVEDTTYNIKLVVQKVEGVFDLGIGISTGTSVSFTEAYVAVKYTKTTD